MAERYTSEASFGDCVDILAIVDNFSIAVFNGDGNDATDSGMVKPGPKTGNVKKRPRATPVAFS
jgi:hypothetical protein